MQQQIENAIDINFPLCNNKSNIATLCNFPLYISLLLSNVAHDNTIFLYNSNSMQLFRRKIYEQNGHVYILQEIVCVPCPLEDQNGFLVSNLDDGHILLIGRVLEIKPKDERKLS